MKFMFLAVTYLAIVLVGGESNIDSGARAPEISVSGWGGLIDPDGDCKFTIEMGSLRMGLPGSDHSLGYERGVMNAPRTIRGVEGDFIAQVEVSGSFPAGATSLLSNRRPFHGAGLLVWLDEKNYIRLERAELVFDGQNMSYANFECRTDGEFVRKGDASELPLPEGPMHLRLERRGSTLLGEVSSDGVHWTAMKPITIELPQQVSVGVVASHNTSSPFEPEFKSFKVYTLQGK
jgi:regulation of enolase protein 1 (concanavalin A-like superfamily)